ncbi:MAG: DUF3566 domain-containing protein [Acidimicrobiales bacterium]
MSSESVSTRGGKRAASQYRAAASRQLKASASRRKQGPAASAKPSRGQPLAITGVSSLSVFRVSLVFYSLLFLIVMVGFIILWHFFGASGYEQKANHLIDSLVGSATYHIQGLQILVIFIGLGVVWIVVAAALTVIASRVFNLVAELIGGMTIYVRSGATPRS